MIRSGPSFLLPSGDPPETIEPGSCEPGPETAGWVWKLVVADDLEAGHCRYVGKPEFPLKGGRSKTVWSFHPTIQLLWLNEVYLRL